MVLRSCDHVLTSYWPSYRRPSCYERKSAHSPSDTSLSNADCKLAATADSTFESALIGGIRPTVRVNVSTHLPTEFMQTSRCVLKICMCLLSISFRFYRFYNRKDTGSIMKRNHSYLYTLLFMLSLNNNYKINHFKSMNDRLLVFLLL